MAGRNLSVPYAPPGAKRIDDDDDERTDPILTRPQSSLLFLSTEKSAGRGESGPNLYSTGKDLWSHMRYIQSGEKEGDSWLDTASLCS